MTDCPVLEAVGEVLAQIEGEPEAFRRGRDDNGIQMPEGAYRHYYLATIQQATFIVEHLASLGWMLSPTPIVNAGEGEA